jgi:hypothetical protein
VSAPKFTPAELELLVGIVTDPNPDHAQRRLFEAFGDGSGRATARLVEASVAADRLRNGQPVDLGDGTMFGRLTDRAPTPPGDRLVEGVDLEQFIGQLAGLKSASTADRMLAAAVAELGISHLLGPCQRLLDRLRDEGASPACEAEPIAGDLWRFGDTVARLCESVRSMHPASHGARLRASLTGCVRAGRQLYVEASLASLPQRLGEVAAEISEYQPLVLSVTPGRLHLDGMPWGLRPGLRGRTALEVTLVDAGGRRAGHGVVIEVLDPRDVDALAHELVHAGGGHGEDAVLRLGHDLARWATASGW